MTLYYKLLSLWRNMNPIKFSHIPYNFEQLFIPLFIIEPHWRFRNEYHSQSSANQIKNESNKNRPNPILTNISEVDCEQNINNRFSYNPNGSNNNLVSRWDKFTEIIISCWCPSKTNKTIDKHICIYDVYIWHFTWWQW